ncbi:WD repeat protein Lub1 [Dispira parvispora]|uniref:WD repeat protein Lub1 n=1 Tax=Dispira parvispora TaxID=1520584 RepID=A0A9W8ARM3_9FUNG|nr:WD repeat protein Lub1 [Dispira parvispora]
MEPFRLAAILTGHEADVRAVLGPQPNVYYTASRDTTIRAWSRDSSSAFPRTVGVFVGHSKYVSSLALLPPNATYPAGLLASGGMDRSIRLYDPSNVTNGDTAQPMHTLEGHRDNVCCLTVTQQGDLVSGSWDGTAKVWHNWQVATELVGHQYAIWAVLSLPDGSILTGSADKLIKRWQGSNCVGTYRGHTDCVRGLALLSDTLGDPHQATFASCSNDGTIRLWTLDGTCVQVLHGHTSFIYSLCCLPSGELVSSGEDRTVKVWRDNACIQTLTLPAQSIWSVETTPEGDVLVGSSNRTAYLFTRSPDKYATSEAIQQYEDQLASFTTSKKSVGEEVSDKNLSDPSILQQPGRKEGQVVMIKEPTGAVTAHQWESLAQRWVKVGTVVDAIDENRRQLHEGREYDYVFTVDVEEGKPPLKLPYNRGQDPFVAAQEFLNTHLLPQSYLDEVVQFIKQNADADQTPVTTTSREYTDPFTGASRYVPAATSGVRQGTTSAADANGGQRDPFTGTSSYRPVDGGQPAVRFTPPTNYVTMKQCNVPVVVGKIKQWNTDFRTSQVELALEDNQLATLGQLEEYLSAAMVGSTVPSTFNPTPHYEVLEFIGAKWPVDKRFPALDLLRLLVCFAPVTQLPTTQTDSEFLNFLLVSSELRQGEVDPDSKPHLTLFTLTLRVLVNLFADQASAQLVWNHREEIMDLVLRRWSQFTGVQQSSNAPQGSTLWTTCRLALATLLLNLCVFQTRLGTTGDSDVYPSQLLTWLIELLAPLAEVSQPTKPTQEALYRGLVAVGTLLECQSSLRPVAKLFNLPELLTKYAQPCHGESVNHVTKSIQPFV